MIKTIDEKQSQKKGVPQHVIKWDLRTHVTYIKLAPNMRFVFQSILAALNQYLVG